MRVQLALNVDDLETAVEFYETLLGVPVAKRKPGYANFAVDQPPLKLVLFENPGATERLNHLGVEVSEDAEVRKAVERLKAAGLADRVEDETTCCYATQDKVWATDPQGARWEIYRVLRDSETFGGQPPGDGDAERVRDSVRAGYTDVAERRLDSGDAARHADRIGYAEADLAAVPDGANLGVGCGNPTAIDSLRPGETVLDLGSGAGMDAFLAARQVGPEGCVIGVDMTDAMLEKARENARKVGAASVEFRKGLIEDLPVDDGSVDAVISNCVINLSPEKPRVFQEAYRVLRPGGRLMVSDVVLERPLPEAVVKSAEAWIGCVSGASQREAYLAAIRDAGFREVQVTGEASFGHAFPLDAPEVRKLIGDLGISEGEARDYAGAVTSLHVFARK